MQEKQDGSFGEMFEVNLRTEEDSLKKLAELAKDPQTKAIHFGTRNQLQQIKRRADKKKKAANKRFKQARRISRR